MGVRRGGRSHSGVRLAALAAGLSVLAVACASEATGTVTYRDSDRQSLFKLPTEWNLYQHEELTEVSVPFVIQGEDFRLPVVSQMAFDGAPARDPGNLERSIATSDFPIGAVTVREIGAQERDFISRFLLAELVVPYHSQLGSQEILKQDFVFENGYQGVELAVAYTDSVTEADAAVYLISVTDPGVTRMYSIAVGCSLDCFRNHEEDIVAVLDSYLVNTRG